MNGGSGVWTVEVKHYEEWRYLPEHAEVETVLRGRVTGGPAAAGQQLIAAAAARQMLLEGVAAGSSRQLQQQRVVGGEQTVGPVCHTRAHVRALTSSHGYSL